MPKMPKLSKPAIGAAVLGGAAGAHYLNKKRNEDPTRKPWDVKTDYQVHYDYIVLGGKHSSFRKKCVPCISHRKLTSYSAWLFLYVFHCRRYRWMCIGESTGRGSKDQRPRS